MMSLCLFSLRSVSSAGIFLFLTTLFCAFFLSTPPAHAAPCAKYTSGSAVPAGYGASYDLWNLTNGSLLNTDCTTSAFSIQVGNGDTTTANFAVYKTGYRWTGSAWQAITFVPDGGESSGNYIMGKAKNEGTLSYAGTDSYFVAFTCSLRAGAWKCGCRDTGCGRGYWQLQAVVKPSTGGTGTGGGGGSSTSYSCGSTNITRRWNPPALTNPETITVTNQNNTLKLDRGKDYLVTCSEPITSKKLSIEGGRNIVVKSCKINLNAGCPKTSYKANNDSYNWFEGIKINGFTGSFLSFEDLHIDVADCIADGIAIAKNIDQWRDSTLYDVYFFNTVIYAGNGRAGNDADGNQIGFHADVFHDQDAISEKARNLYIEHTMSGSWMSGWTDYWSDNTYVQNSSVVPNDVFGKVCKPIPAGNGDIPSICSTNPKIHPSYMGYNLYAYENVYGWGCAPCETPKRNLVSGTITQTLAVNNYTCLSAAAR